MLSEVLHSARAIAVNVQIMRASVRMRELLGSNKELAEKLDQLERKLQSHDERVTPQALPALHLATSALFETRVSTWLFAAYVGCQRERSEGH